MKKLILVALSLMFTLYGFSQEMAKTYYLRKYHNYSPSGKVNFYDLLYVYGNNIELTTIKVFGEIGNPVTTTFFIDTCYHQLGEFDSLNTGYVVLRDGQKRKFKIKKKSYRIMRLDFNEFIAKYKRIPETVNLVIKLKNICSCY